MNKRKRRIFPSFRDEFIAYENLDDRLFWQKHATAIKRFYDWLFHNDTWITTLIERYVGNTFGSDIE